MTTHTETNIELAVAAHRAAQRAAMEARDTLRSADDAVRHAKLVVAQAESTVEYLAQFLRSAS